MKILALCLLAIVAFLQYRLWVSDSGMREVWRLRREVAVQTDQNSVLKDRNRSLAAEVQDLKKGKSAIEERARTDLGMVGTNETFFQVANQPGDTSEANDANASDTGSVSRGADQPVLTRATPAREVGALTAQAAR